MEKLTVNRDINIIETACKTVMRKKTQPQKEKVGNCMKRYLYIFTMCLTVLLLFNISCGVFAAEPSEKQESFDDFSVFVLGENIGVSSAPTYTSPYTNLTYNIPSEVKALGVDVSFWKGEIDWEAVAADGIDFALIRAAGRHHNTGAITTDSWFAANVEGAQAAGIKVGAYIFSQAITEQEAEEEAQYLIDLVSDYNLELPIVMDYEYRSDSTDNLGRLKAANLSKREGTDICLAFCDYVKEHNYIPMLYANTDMLNHLYPEEIKENMDLWYARWGATPYVSGFSLWQYSAEGNVNGIDGDVDCSFSFVDLDVLGMPFDDVPEGSWFFNSVLYAYQNRLFNGMDSDTFAPGAAMSRGMLVSVLHRLEGTPTVDGTSGFTDVKAGDWYEDGVLWAEEIGIVNGIGDGKFAPEKILTREQIATFLYRYSEYKEYDLADLDTLNIFSDKNYVSDYALTPMQWAVGNGYICGDDKQKLCPWDRATRAQVAIILMRFCQDHEIE
jgi:GH25 family lysozyme M1 (1,4-beta-N-acetylmuramidase)